MSQNEESKTSTLVAKSRWVLPLILWGILTICSGPFLQRIEERSLFEFDTFWMGEFLNKPSGLLTWCGLFLTQFLHIPWLGAFIWVMLLTASAELTRKLFSIPSGFWALAYIPAAILVAYNMSIGYMIYLMNCPGFFFTPVLGYLWAILTLAVLRKTRKPFSSLVLMLALGGAGYYIAGFYSLVGILASAIDIAVSDRPRLSRILPAAGAVAGILLVPILFAGATTYHLASGWTIGLPDHIHSVSLARMQLPIVLALLFLPLASLFPLLHLDSRKALPVVQDIILAAVIAIPASFWYRDANFKTELKMIRAVDNLEWDKVPDIYQKITDKKEKDLSWQPTRVMVVLKDLALIKTGQEGERAYAFEDGCMEQKRKWNAPMSFQIGWILGFHYGIPGLCQRWCHEENVLFGWSNSTLKYSIMTAILFGNTELAEKYLDKLDNTLFYRKWAKEQRRLLNDKSLVTETAPYNLVLPLMCYDDIVCSDQEGSEIFLERHFNNVSPQHSTPLYDRVALFFAMKSKDPTLFWTRFFLYLDSNNPKKIDRFYQEAAYLYSQFDKNGLFETLPFDDKVKNLYDSFSSYAAKYGQKSMDEARQLFPENQRRTFFYYYYYVDFYSVNNTNMH